MKNLLFIILLVSNVVAVNAQTTSSKSLTLDAAKKIVAEARKFGVSVNAPHGGPSIAVVDRGGNLLFVERPETTFAGSALVAYEKAHTAVMFEQPTQNMENAIKGGRTPLITVGYVMLEGGVPIIVNGEIVGAIGVSGAASSAQDVEIALAGAKTKID
ncbi:MAG: heme-binding protein [Cyclobacteriaceae bacterium]|nr:heme-binding protein [Cyclobacteriaceae bacterium]